MAVERSSRALHRMLVAAAIDVNDWGYPGLSFKLFKLHLNACSTESTHELFSTISSHVPFH